MDVMESLNFCSTIKKGQSKFDNLIIFLRKNFFSQT